MNDRHTQIQFQISVIALSLILVVFNSNSLMQRLHYSQVLIYNTTPSLARKDSSGIPCRKGIL